MKKFFGGIFNCWLIVAIIISGLIINVNNFSDVSAVDIPEKCLKKNTDNKSYKDNTSECQTWRKIAVLNVATCNNAMATLGGFDAKINTAILEKCKEVREADDKAKKDAVNKKTEPSIEECRSTSAISKTPECQAVVAKANQQDNDKAKARQENIDKTKALKKCMTDRLDKYIEDNSFNASKKSVYLGEIRSIKDDGNWLNFDSYSIDMHLAQLFKDCGGNISDDKLKGYNNQVKEEAQAAQSEEGESSCNIDKVGWIICPSANFLAESVMESYKFVAENFLEVKSSDLFAEKENGVKQSWNNFRDMANVIFVILFAIVIISQTTGIGIGNYGIKKILPRLIIFAVLINISYYISVIFVDISNILGKSFFNMIVGASYDSWSGAGGDENLMTVVTLGLTGTAVGAISAVFFGGVMLAALLTAIIGLIIVMATLMIRQAAVIILVVLSPIAFASAILPNTESVFNKWKSLFKSMLVIYPVASIVVSLSTMASNVLVGTSTDNILMKGLYMTIPLLGMASVIAMIKASLSALDKLTGGNLTGKLAAMEKGANKFAGNTSAVRRLKNWNRGNTNAFTGKADKNTKLGRFIGGAGKRLGVASAAGFLRDSRMKADLGDAVNDDAEKRSMREAQIRQLELKEANGSIIPKEQQYLNGLRAQKHKEEQDMINARAGDIAKSAGMNASVYQSGLSAAFRSGDHDEIVTQIRALNSGSLTGGDKAKVLSSVVGGLSAAQLQSESVRRAITSAQPELSKLRSKDLVSVETLNEAAKGGQDIKDASGNVIGKQTRTRSEIAADGETYVNAMSAGVMATQAGSVLQGDIIANEQNFTQAQKDDIASKAALAMSNQEINSDITNSSNLELVKSWSSSPQSSTANTSPSPRRYGGSSGPGYNKPYRRP